MQPLLFDNLNVIKHQFPSESREVNLITWICSSDIIAIEALHLLEEEVYLIVYHCR